MAYIASTVVGARKPTLTISAPEIFGLPWRLKFPAAFGLDQGLQPFQGGLVYSFRPANSLAVDTCGCFLL